jgi:hypothetical protein
MRFFVFSAAGGIVRACIFGFDGYGLGAEFHRFAGPFGLAAPVLVRARWGRAAIRASTKGG